MREKSESIFSLIIVFAVDEREVVVEKRASFTTGFGKTLLFENDCCNLSVRYSLVCTLRLYIHLAAKLVSVALVFFGLAFPTFSFSFWKSFFLSFLCLLDFVIVCDERILYPFGGCKIYMLREYAIVFLRMAIFFTRWMRRLQRLGGS